MLPIPAPIQLAAPTPAHPALDLAIAAWLAAKAGRSGSKRTERAYADALTSFRAALHAAALDLDGPPAAVALVAQAWAAANEPAPATHNQRLAILSSFYLYARRQGLLDANPIDRIERRPIQRYGSSKALSLDTVRQGLAAIDRTTLEGQRDYCLLAVALQTGRRLSELANLRWGDVEVAGGAITLIWRRTKGGKRMQDTLPAPLSRALAEYLRALHGAQLRGLPADAAVWASLSTRNPGAPIGTSTVRRIVEAHLGTTKVHSLRHTFARSMEETGAKLSEIQQRLGHSNAATTGIYVAALRSNENAHADALAALLGLD